MVHVSKTRAIERLQELVDKAAELNPENGRSQKFKSWAESVCNSFYHILGEDSYQYSRLPGSYRITSSRIQEYFTEMVATVEASLDHIKHFWPEDNGEAVVNSTDREKVPTHDLDEVNIKPGNDKVFVFHGLDHTVWKEVARFLETLKLKSIVLHEQTNKDYTIIEKFEDYADVNFALVLLTLAKELNFSGFDFDANRVFQS